MSYFTRIGSLLRQPALEREFDEEILFHLQTRTAQNRERGMTAEAAEAEARRRFGSVDGAKAGMRQARIAKPLALYEALYGGHAVHAAPGETVCVPIVAQDYKASAIVMGYIKASLRKIGTGFSVVTDELVETVRLSNGLEFRRFPPSPNALRGVAAPFFVLDEAAHLPREGNANAEPATLKRAWRDSVYQRNTPCSTLDAPDPARRRTPADGAA